MQQVPVPQQGLPALPEVLGVELGIGYEVLGQFQAEARVGDDAHCRLERARGRADGAHDGPFGWFPRVGQHSHAVQPGERVQRQLGAVEPPFPQASACPEALESGRYAAGDTIQWLAICPYSG